MSSKKNTEAPAAKIARNPSDKTARAMYDAVVAHEGTVGGKAARIALYGTKYAALEVGGEGAWEVDHDTAFGGVRAIESLRGGFDEVLVLGHDSREIQLTAGNVAVVEPEIVAADPVAVDFVEAAPSADVVEAVVVLPVVVAAEPVLATLEEVRAAHDAETRGACRASVLRALRVRAGEIALGLPAGGKAEKVTTSPDVKRTVSARTDVRSLVEAAITASENGEKPVGAADLGRIGFGPSACTQASRWGNGGCGQVAAALGWRTRFSSKTGVTFTRAE